MALTASPRRGRSRTTAAPRSMSRKRLSGSGASTEPERTGHEPQLPREQLRWWALLLVAWTSLAAAQAAVATVALEGGVNVLVHSALLFGTTAWVTVATTPLVVWLARRLEWRGLLAVPAHAARVIGLHAAMLLIVAS